MLHGHIYPQERVPRALDGFFRTSNLAALRELALRFVADEVDDSLLASTFGGDTPYETTERILVAVTASLETEAVIRRAARLAARARADLHAVHVSVASDNVDGSADVLARCARLVGDVGGSWSEIHGEDAARLLVAYAREHQVTQIVLGSTRRSRWGDLLGASPTSRILRYAADSAIDVHIIGRRDPSVKEPKVASGKKDHD